MIFNYILDEQNNPVPEPDLLTWARWRETAERHAGNTFFAGEAIQVSTVFLGIDHNFGFGGAPVLYETMVFAESAVLRRLSELSETDDRGIIAQFISALGGKPVFEIQRRYCTRDEAQEGHRCMCNFIEVCLAKGLVFPVVVESTLETWLLSSGEEESA